MYIVVLTYTQAIEKVDALVPAHREWLDQQYAAGHFVASGRRVPRTGGVIIARGLDREALDKVLAQDPFQQNGVASYEVLEFVPSMVAEGLAVLAE